MTTIFVSHRSALVAYIVAAALKLYYRHRTLRIVIVELFDKASAISDNRPYCGVSTISNLRLAYWPFLHSVLLTQVLAGSVEFAESVQVHECGPTSRITPELPVWAQFLTVVARRGDASHFLALFYLPQVLESALFAFLAESPNVSFMSVQNHQTVPAVIDRVSRFLQAEAFSDLWLHFGTGAINNRTTDLDILASSRICGLQLLGGTPPPSKPLARFGVLQDQDSQFGRYCCSNVPQRMVTLPNSNAGSVLWLPLFKGAAGMFSEPILNQHLHYNRQLISVSITPLNLNDHEEVFASRHDLLYALKTCDFVLSTVEDMFDRHRLDVTLPRL